MSSNLVLSDLGYTLENQTCRLSETEGRRACPLISFPVAGRGARQTPLHANTSLPPQSPEAGSEGQGPRPCGSEHFTQASVQEAPAK